MATFLHTFNALKSIVPSNHNAQKIIDTCPWTADQVYRWTTDTITYFTQCINTQKTIINEQQDAVELFKDELNYELNASSGFWSFINRSKRSESILHLNTELARSHQLITNARGLAEAYQSMLRHLVSMRHSLKQHLKYGQSWSKSEEDKVYFDETILNHVFEAVKRRSGIQELMMQPNRGYIVSAAFMDLVKTVVDDNATLMLFQSIHRDLAFWNSPITLPRGFDTNLSFYIRSQAQ